ncbi:hypothetical protein [Pseudomonas guariconensis]|uniref:hypothetical protein n=1 Tax=Pseudomonas guariconensis TaxID=1288410 RepID=UPI0034658083
MDDSIPLGQVYAAIEAHIKEAIPSLAYVGTMPEKIEHIRVPGAVIELTGFEAADKDPGTGEVAVETRFETRIIIGREQAECLAVAAHCAAQLTVLLRMQHWGLPVEFAEFIRAERDWTHPQLDSCVVWVVEWSQVIYLGKEEWPWPNQPPGSLVIGFSPNTGPGSEDAYQPPEAMG